MPTLVQRGHQFGTFFQILPTGCDAMCLQDLESFLQVGFRLRIQGFTRLHPCVAKVDQECADNVPVCLGESRSHCGFQSDQHLQRFLGLACFD